VLLDSVFLILRGIEETHSKDEDGQWENDADSKTDSPDAVAGNTSISCDNDDGNDT